MPNKRKKKVFGTAEKPRLVVFRSNRYMHAQLIDDSKGLVIVGMNDKSKIALESLKNEKTKTDASRALGKLIADEAKKKNVSKIVFDRNGYIYHGRIKAFADGAREGGLDF